MSDSSLPDTEADVDNMAGNHDNYMYPAFRLPTPSDSSDDSNYESDHSERPNPGESSDSNSENNCDPDESEEEEMDSDYEDIGDEDDDEEGIDYDEVIESEMLQIIQQIVFEGAWSDDEDEQHDGFFPNPDDDDGDNGHRYTCTCPSCLMKIIPGSTDFTDSKETDKWGTEVPLHPEASPCAVCMEPETWTRTFVDMPCCGPASSTRTPYDTSSTRFCQKCFCRCIAMHRCAVPCQDSMVQMAGECPRCKKILVLQESKTDSLQDYFDSTRPLYARTKPQLPSCEALFWYVARNGNKDTAKYLPYLVTLALCSNPSYIPEELLMERNETPEELRTLCQWGLLLKKETNKTVEQLHRILFKDLYLAPLGRLWEGLVSIVEPKLASVKTAIYDWKLSQIYRSVRETLRIEESQDRTAVYCMDPIFHSQLRQYVLLYVHPSKDSEEDFYLMSPILKGVSITTDQMSKLVIIQERSSRILCARGAWASFRASSKALRRLHLWKGIWLTNHALSLFVLSVKELGVPPICDWCDSNKTVALHKTRFRWHLLTVCNIILTIQIWKIVWEIFWIGWNLLVGASVCLVVGKIVGAFTDKRQHHEEWLVIAQIAACAFAVLYVGWNLGLHNTIKDVVYLNLKQEL